MDCIELLRELIRFDTVNPPGNEKPAAQYLTGLLQTAGFRCEVQDLGGNRANLIAVLGGGDGPELMLTGHLDVVPAVGAWDSSPFSMAEKDGRLYGRGTSDMKGGIAAMCEAAMGCAARKEPMKGSLKLLFVADEECSNLGTLSYLKTHGGSGYAIIGEPTRLEVAVAHRGVSRDYIDIKGAPRHAALPAGEEDAVMKACRAVLAVNDMNETLRHVTHPVLPPPGIAVTMIEGYEKDNVVPGNVRLLLDFRIHPGMDHEQVGRFLDKGFEQAGIDGCQRTLRYYMPGGEIRQDDRFVKLCLEERERLLGIKSFPQPFEASCEQCFLTEQGIRTVICGPGDIAQAHTVGEFTWEKQVRDAVKLYGRIIDRILYKTKYN